MKVVVLEIFIDMEGRMTQMLQKTLIHMEALMLVCLMQVET